MKENALSPLSLSIPPSLYPSSSLLCFSFPPFDPSCLSSPAVFSLISSVSLQARNTSVPPPNASWRSLKTFHRGALPEASLLPGVLVCPTWPPYLHHAAVAYTSCPTISLLHAAAGATLFRIVDTPPRLSAIFNFCREALQWYTLPRWLDPEIQAYSLLWLVFLYQRVCEGIYLSWSWVVQPRTGISPRIHTTTLTHPSAFTAFLSF